MCRDSEIYDEFSTTDMVLGAHNMSNPAANVPGSPIYGIPTLEFHKACTVLWSNAGGHRGYSGLDNDLFHMDKTMMLFGDTRKVVVHRQGHLSPTGLDAGSFWPNNCTKSLMR